MSEHIDLRYIQQRLSEKISNKQGQLKKAGEDYLPASGKVVSDSDLLHGIDAVLDAWFTTGVYTEKFEKSLSSFVGSKYAFLVNSGSSANLLAFFSLTSEKLGERAVKKGDEVITVACGFPTTINPIIQFGAIPVFVDVDLESCNIDCSLLEQALSSKTKAVMLAHTLGNPFDIETIEAFCKKNNLWLIEDNCDALGAIYNGRKTGSFGDLATLSFYPAHHITTGEGGAVLVNNPKLKKIVESFRDWGRDCWCASGCDDTCGKRFQWDFDNMPTGYDHKYIYSHIGFNLKATDIQAAIGYSQLISVASFIEKRRANHSYLRAKLQHLYPRIQFQKEEKYSDASWFGFLIYLNDPKINRTKLTQYLENQKIGTRLLFGGNLTKQPAYKNATYRIASELTNSDNIMHNAFWVGVWPGLENEHLDYIAKHIQLFLEKNA